MKFHKNCVFHGGNYAENLENKHNFDINLSS